MPWLPRHTPLLFPGRFSAHWWRRFSEVLYRGECRNIAQIDKPLQGLDRHRRLLFFFHRLEQAELKAIVDSTRADIVVVG
jgi:hypothetical protein